MGRLVVHQDKIEDANSVIKICPFGAMEIVNGKVEINASCRMCKVCVRKGPKGAFEFVEDENKVLVNKDEWRGIAVYVDHVNGEIHPVTLELIGKARELADKINQKVYCLFMGNGIKDKAGELLHYGVDEVIVYDYKELENFRIEPYTAVFYDFINKIKPCSILVGATTLGRSLAPRVAARCRTGLTADCTILDIKENTDLVQIRPVRYKVMSAPERNDECTGEIKYFEIEKDKLKSDIEVKEIKQKPKEHSISDAEVIVVAGRGVKSEKDLEIIKELADLLGGELAVTRPLIENGWADANRQVGLSGRTVRPKLIITCGVSGAIQFVAGMNNADYIFAINKDEKAPIFKVAHYGIVL